MNRTIIFLYTVVVFAQVKYFRLQINVYDKFSFPGNNFGFNVDIDYLQDQSWISPGVVAQHFVSMNGRAASHKRQLYFCGNCIYLGHLIPNL